MGAAPGVNRVDDFLKGHPAITFTARGFSDQGGGKFKIHGTLNMHGVSQPIELDADITNTIKDPWGLNRRAATAHATLNRKEFGLTWNQVLEAGGLLVSEDVKLHLDIQAVHQG